MTTGAYDIAVLGAGPAGLAAALQTARRGFRVVVLERADGPGGMAASFEVAGLRVDHGSHRLHLSIEPSILADLRSLLGNDLQTRERHGRIRLQDRWIAFPLRTGDMLRHLPRRFAARAALDTVTAPFRHAQADTFAEVVRARLGPTVAREFYEPYVRKLWDSPPEELSGELARRRVSATSPLAIARRLVRGRRPEGRTFLYPRRGFGQISEALADAAVEAGADIRLNTEVTGANLGTASSVVALRSGDQIETRRVWSTLPLPAVASWFTPAPDPDVAGAARRLQHRAMVLVYLVLDQPRYTEFDAHYFPQADVAVARLSEPKNYRHDPNDPQDRTVLCAEVACWEGDERWTASPEEMGDLVIESLMRAGLPEPAPVAVEVRRLPRVYPVYRPGFQHDLAALERWAADTGLLTFGRQGLFAPDNTHHALAMGWAAAASLDGPDPTGGSFDEARWLAARDGFRSYVVED
ncbi:MAG: FAD-dependent oxidoreductase [Actinobacteria bacterium]|nr:FAD-dependent oxidoreductase [Actinomycetota bacterium]